jgi:outer membrane receptor protein involved in Fe transport
VPCNLNVTGVGTWNETSPRNGFQWTARVDHNFNQGKDRLYGSFNRTTTEKVGNPGAGPEIYPGFTGLGPTNSSQANTNWTRIFSSNLVNEMQFSWVHVAGSVSNPHPDIPGISVTGIAGYQVGWGPNEFVQNNFNWSDVVTVDEERPQHEGGPRLHARARGQRLGAGEHEADLHLRHAVRLRGGPAQRGGADGARPSLRARGRSELRYHRTQSVSAFLQDDWKVRPNLTLSLGLRYEGFLNVRDASDAR